MTMDDKTVINPALREMPETEINNEILPRHEGEMDRAYAPPSDSVDAGTILFGKYTVERRLEVASGEADLYLCSFEDAHYVAKLYRRQAAIKQDVAERLLQINSPYVARVFESSTYNGLPAEVLRYYPNGSLQGKKFTCDELVDTVIPNINEGLHVLHQAGIIHKDLKPSNIMVADDGKSVAIIDFGISSVIIDSIVVTKTGMTPEYSAPETFRNVFLEESDYFSFGVTLFELFTGYAPYANMSAKEIDQYMSVQKIHFPDDMPTVLSDLISALTYYDITSRTDKTNPNRRWTYSEVKGWLAGENLAIPGEGGGNVGKGTMPPYRFMDEDITDRRILVEAFAKNWKEGKRHLFRGLVSAHFRAFDQETANRCLAAEEEASRTSGKDDIIFWKLLYMLSPNMKGFYWKNRVFESLPALGRDLLDRLWKKDKSQNKYFETVLSEKLLTEYAALAAPENEPLQKAAAAMEESYRLEKTAHTDLTKTFYLMAYTLSGQRLLYLEGRCFRTVDELAEYMNEQCKKSVKVFRDLCRKMVDHKGNLDTQLEMWLIAIGKKRELDNWRALMRE
jgi:serine/threonine protein kinase